MFLCCLIPCTSINITVTSIISYIATRIFGSRSKLPGWNKVLLVTIFKIISLIEKDTTLLVRPDDRTVLQTFGFIMDAGPSYIFLFIDSMNCFLHKKPAVPMLAMVPSCLFSHQIILSNITNGTFDDFIMWNKSILASSL